MKKQSFFIQGMIMCLALLANKGHSKTSILQPREVAYVDSGLKELSIIQSEELGKLVYLMSSKGLEGLNDDFGDGQGG